MAYRLSALPEQKEVTQAGVAVVQVEVVASTDASTDASAAQAMDASAARRMVVALGLGGGVWGESGLATKRGARLGREAAHAGDTCMAPYGAKLPHSVSGRALRH